VLGGFADQYVIGSRSGAGADAEQGIKGSMLRPAPVEAGHELIKVVLEVGFPQSMVNAQGSSRLVSAERFLSMHAASTKLVR
jgi:hypothetical protein